MRDLQDFNDPTHRIASAGAAFQRGVYHLYILQQRTDIDSYSSVIRSYQAVYQLCLTILLLDFDCSIQTRSVPKRLRTRAADARRPSRAEIDPSAVITHSVFEDGQWTGPPSTSSLRQPAVDSLKLIKRVVEARHNLIYRPFLLDRGGLLWEDCTLLSLLAEIPEPSEIQDVYERFVASVLAQRAVEIRSREELQRLLPTLPAEETFAQLARSGKNWADYFIQLQFWPFADKRGERPTETILATYCRMLQGEDTSRVAPLLEFRNALLRLADIEPLNLDSDWRPGQI